MLTKTTGIAQSSGTIRSAAPFGSLGSIAGMAATRRSRPAPSFLRVSTGKPTGAFHLIHETMRVFVSLAGGGFAGLSIVDPLLSQRLLLSLNQIADPGHGVENALLLAHDIVTLQQRWQ